MCIIMCLEIDIRYQHFRIRHIIILKLETLTVAIILLNRIIALVAIKIRITIIYLMEGTRN